MPAKKKSPSKPKITTSKFGNKRSVTPELKSDGASVPPKQSISHRQKGDIVIAATIAIVAIPQSLAYAQLIGLPAFTGLWGLIIGTTIAGLVGHSRILSTGPTAVISLMTAAAIANMPVEPTDKIAAAAALAIVVGIIQMSLGVLKAGKLVTIITYPVIIGFTSAAALIIALNQSHVLLGVSSVEASTKFLQSAAIILRNLGHISLAESGMGITAFVLLLAFKYLSPKVPSSLLVIAIMMGVSAWIGYEGPTVGVIPTTLPQLAVPGIATANITSLFVSALLIAVVGYVEGVSMIRSQTSKTKEHLRENQEFVGQGIANFVVGLLGSFPVAGSVSRTTIAAEQGRRSRTMNILVGLMALFAMIVFAQYFSYLPRAVLAAIIIVSVVRLFNIPSLNELITDHPRDAVVAIITLLASLAFSPHIAYGIALGVLSALLIHVHRSASPSVEVFFCDDKKYLKDHHYHLRTYPTNKKVLAVTINGEFSFANADEVASRVEDKLKEHRKPKYVLFFARGINNIDTSAEVMLHELHDRLKKKKITMIFSGIKPEVLNQMKHCDLYHFIGEDHIFRKPNEALTAVSKAG